MICFKCGGELKKYSENKYFTRYLCIKCQTPYCRAHDSRNTWSWLKTTRMGLSDHSHYVDCTKEMDEVNTEKVIFT